MHNFNNDIENYINGRLSASEMHALEKRALEDPFLADALEGALHNQQFYKEDIQELRERLHHKVLTYSKPVRSLTVWEWTARIAAGLLLLAVSTFVILKFVAPANDEHLASNEQPKSDVASKADEKVKTDSTNDQGELLSMAKPEEQPQTESAEKPKSKTVAPRSSETDMGPLASSTQPVVDESQAEDAEKEIAEGAKVEEPGRQASSQASSFSNDAQLAERKTMADEQVRSKKGEVKSSAAAPMQRADDALSVAYDRLVSGKVVSAEDHVGLPGVNVFVKGTNVGAVTDANGNYQIRVSDTNQDLTFSFIGMESIDVTAADKSRVDVALQEDLTQLSEVVVTGYGYSGDRDEPEQYIPLEMAVPNGGRKAFKQYLEQGIQYPAKALENNVEGKVTVQFIVDPNGRLTDFKILKGIGYGCEEELIRLIKEGPAWAPTKRGSQTLQDKVKVRMKFSIPKK